MANRIHTDGNTLKPSPLDLAELVKELETRFKEVCDLYLKVRGVELRIPESLKSEFLLWRTLFQRHKAAWDKVRKDRSYPIHIENTGELYVWMGSTGLFLHTLDERRAVEIVAQWLLDQNCALRNQPLQKMEFHW